MEWCLNVCVCMLFNNANTIAAMELKCCIQVVLNYGSNIALFVPQNFKLFSSGRYYKIMYMYPYPKKCRIVK